MQPVLIQKNFRANQEDFGLVCQHSYLLDLRQIVFFLGMLSGCLVTGHISDCFGRKTTMLGCMFAWSASAIVTAFVYDIKVFLILQFVLAFSCSSAWTSQWSVTNMN